MICGLLGAHLGHSYSPAIHGLLGNYEYRLFDKSPEEVEAFLRSGEFTGLNVTMPYKKAVIPYLDVLSPQASLLGAVNTIVRQEDGTLWGHNTDFFGFSYLLKQSQLALAGKKVLVLGSGGASATVQAVLRQHHARVTVISRQGENNYGNLELQKDAALIINTTPLGMYPHTGAAALDLRQFPHLERVLDVIYNPARTQLLLDAEALGIPGVGGLSMLVAQAWEASQCFTGQAIPTDVIPKITKALQARMENLVLVGMPGCGKTTLGRLAAEKMGRPFADADHYIEKHAGMSIPEIFEQFGEAHFRLLETEVLEELGKQSGLVIACGGGAVTQARNYPLLHQNGCIFWIQRELSALATQGRPLSKNLQELCNHRLSYYEAFADGRIINDSSLEAVTEKIVGLWEALHENTCY